MAVQAQYRSNLLPFCSATSRSVDPEMKKATGGGLTSDAQARQGNSGFLQVDQHHALFFPGVTASNLNNDTIINNTTPLQKRPRDASEGGTATGGGFLNTPASCDLLASSAMMSRGGLMVPAQAMLPQVLMTPSLAGLSQPRPQDDVPVSMVSTGLRLSLEDRNQMQMQQQRHSTVLAPLSDELAAELKQHKEEIDRYLAVQSEHLRRSIAESRRRHIRSLVSAADESTSQKLREKQSELDRASRTRSDLEAREARVSAECAAWQAKARAGDAAIAALRAQLDRAAADVAHRQAHASAAADGCHASAERAGGSDAASACVDPRREEMERQAAAAAAGSTSSRPTCGSSVSCRQCGSAGATVVLLPCRHLCLCSSCSRDPAVPAVCPVCFCARSVAVEVFFS